MHDASRQERLRERVRRLAGEVGTSPPENLNELDERVLQVVRRLLLQIKDSYRLERRYRRLRAAGKVPIIPFMEGRS